MSRPLRVTIDARLTIGRHGGLEQVLWGMLWGLKRLPPGAVDVRVLCTAENLAWASDAAGADVCEVDAAWRGPGTPRVRSGLEGVLFRTARWMWNQATVIPDPREARVPACSPALERGDPDVVHFAYPDACLTSAPFAYQPFDLLHRSPLATFLPRERARRDRQFRMFGHRAAAVIFMTRDMLHQFVELYEVPADRCHAITLAPLPEEAWRTTDENAKEADALTAGLGRFALFPAQTWPHKNHRGLFKALGALRRTRALDIPVICTGRLRYGGIDERRWAEREGVGDLVRFGGYVASGTVAELYRRSSLLVFPSLYEGWGLPVSEALAFGIPAACSNLPSLREAAGDAAAFFAPDDTADMADAIARAWSDESLRQELRQRGALRVASRTWVDIAADYVRAWSAARDAR